MTSRGMITFIVVIVLIILGGYGVYYYNQQYALNGNTENGTQGKIIFGIKDAAVSMENVSSVLLTVNNAQLHSASDGWITILNDAKEFDLLALKQSGNIAFLASANVNSGTYDQMRLSVSKVLVTADGVTQEAKLPSGELKITGNVVVNSNATATAVFDFIADESLHVTGNGKFIFSPVVHVESRSNATANVDQNNKVTVNEGNVEASSRVGMDLNGEVKQNFAVDSKATLDFVGDVIKITNSEEKNAAVKVTAATASNTAISQGYLDTAISMQLITQDNKKVWSISGLKNLELKNIYIDAVTGAALNVGVNSGAQTSPSGSLNGTVSGSVEVKASTGVNY